MITTCGLCGKTVRPFAAAALVTLCYRPDDPDANCYDKAVIDGALLPDGTHWDAASARWVT